MKNFEFFNPVRILFGEGQIDMITQELLPYQTILLTYGVEVLNGMAFTIRLLAP